MLNQVVLVGRLSDNPTIIELEDGKKEAIVTLGVQRTFKNDEGIYDTDFIKCILWNAVATSTSEYCHKGDIVGVKGRIQSRIVESGDGSKKYYTDIIAERVTFLSSKSSDDSKTVTN